MMTTRVPHKEFLHELNHLRMENAYLKKTL
jgi:hypothetical protein